MQIRMRWLIRRDLSPVLDMEVLSFGGEPTRWTHHDYDLAMIDQRNAKAMVATSREDDVPLGVIIYTLLPTNIELTRIVVHPDVRRCGVATAMMQQIERRIKDTRERADCVVREEYLDVQLLLQSCGWRATGVKGGAISFSLTMADLGQMVIQRIAEGNVGVMHVRGNGVRT